LIFGAMIVYLDLLTGKDIGSDSYEEVKKADGAIIGLISKKIQIADEDVDIGANASAEGADGDDGVEKSEAQTVINLVHSHSLQSVKLDKKEFKAVIKSYWKKLMEHYGEKKYKALGLGADYKAPADKAKAKTAEEKALAKLDKDGKAEVKAVKEEIARFKANFDKLQEFVKTDILGNFDEYEFYIPDQEELGSCIIIPARYEGEALAPTFYIWADGIAQKKE